MTVSAKEKEQIRKQGYASTGGIPKMRYWTPDGRQIEAIPSMREFNRKDENGDVIGSGTRDANLDKGWLLQPPQDPKPYCGGCDKWHDTDEEIIQCIADKGTNTREWDDWARKQVKKDKDIQGGEIEELRVEVKELTGMVYELTQALKKEVK